MFIWDFVADKILGQIVDWFYGQVVGFLGNFFAEMGNMGVELFEMSWVQSIVLFFSYLAWALYGTGLVVACFECGIEYSSGRGNIRETALNAIKGFMAVSLFTVVPVRLYELSVTLQGQLTAGITGYGASIGDVASDIMQEFSAVGHGFVHPHAGGGVGLGVKVAQKHPLPQVFQGRSQVDTGGGLPNAAFLIHDRHDFRHFVHTRFLSVFILVYHIFSRFQ